MTAVQELEAMFIDDDLLGRSGKELLKAGSDLVFGPKGRCAIGVMYLVSRLPVGENFSRPATNCRRLSGANR
jgi:hypothetical protein